MSMVVYKNLSAMNAHRYLKLTESNFSKSVERLSSGLRINRAADDPAGLVISEQFRSQVAGLNQAIKNANDGISLVQTAEGALDEATTLLRSMRNLALHAANTGASDSVAVQADQEQIESAIATMNRIANTTSFGTRKLLNGSSGVTGSSSQSTISLIQGTTKTVAGTYAVDNLTASVKGIHQSDARTGIANFTNTTMTNGAGVLAADSTLTLTGEIVNNQTILMSFSAGDTSASVKADLLEGLNDAGLTWIEAADITVTLAAGGAGVMTVAGLDALGADHADALTIAGTGDLATGAFGRTAAGGVSSTSYMGQDETLTIKDGDGAYISVAIQQADTVGTAISRLNDSLDEAGFKVTASFDDATDKFVLTNDEYGATDVATYSISSNVIDGNADAGTGLERGAAGADQIIAAGGGGTAGANVSGQIGGTSATSVDGIYLVGSNGTNMEGLKVKVDGGTTTAGNVTIDQNSLEFQIGAFSSQTVKVAISDMRTNKLGNTATGTTSMTTIDIESIDVTTAAGAQDAIMVIDAAMDQVNSMRSEMGSFQKDILEASVRNLQVAAQNMAASESSIRDADMAQEMLDFSKAQILQSTGMAMLAQANQAPQAIMRLFG